MLSATFLATYMIPLFYVLVAGKVKQPKPAATPAAVEGAH